MGFRIGMLIGFICMLLNSIMIEGITVAGMAVITVGTLLIFGVLGYAIESVWTLFKQEDVMETLALCAVGMQVIGILVVMGCLIYLIK